MLPHERKSTLSLSPSVSAGKKKHFLVLPRKETAGGDGGKEERTFKDSDVKRGLGWVAGWLAAWIDLSGGGKEEEEEEGRFLFPDRLLACRSLQKMHGVRGVAVDKQERKRRRYSITESEGGTLWFLEKSVGGERGGGEGVTTSRRLSEGQTFWDFEIIKEGRKAALVFPFVAERINGRR